MSSDLPGVNPATLDEMILYYRLMTKWSGLGDSTELSRMGLSHCISRKAWDTEYLKVSDFGLNPVQAIGSDDEA
jgi:hypothetical protein